MTGWNSTILRYPGFDTDDDRRILYLWQKGNNTLIIAQFMLRPEAEVANRLPHILQVARHRELKT